MDLCKEGKELVLRTSTRKNAGDERVKVIIGKSNALVIAPHGHGCDDNRTDIIATNIAETLDCSAVINIGWKRDKKYDSASSKANMNKLDHAFIGSARREFLYPIMTMKNTLMEFYDTLFVFVIHGMFDKVQQKVKGLECVLGYGASFPWWNDSLTIDLWRKDILIKLLSDAGLVTHEGKGGGSMAGRKYSNINQLFRNRNSPFFDDRIQSIQIEMVYKGHRDSPRNATRTGKLLGEQFRTLIDIPEKPEGLETALQKSRCKLY